MIIRQLTMETLQLAGLHEFYCDILGLPLADEDDDSFTMQAGHTEIIFKQHTGQQEPLYHIAFNIPANKIEEASAWIATKAERLYLSDYKSFIADFTNWHAKSVYFYDPAGNVVELIARFDLNNSTEQPFDAEQLISVSEAGLVFAADTFDSQVQQVLDQFNLSYFDKQPALGHFKAVGDDEGLFIIVPEERIWYPTEDKKAILSPIKIYFSNNAIDGWIEYEDGKYEMKATLKG
jgi:catechol 2,3-dioxygenase-like lactoylglutathione lyase family enzyme